MRRATLAAVAALALVECNPTGSSGQPSVTADQVTGELVDAGCLATGPGVVAAVSAEQATGHDPWLACLFDGGTVQGCGVPCGRGSGDR